jgi:hypothetical protein
VLEFKSVGKEVDQLCEQFARAFLKLRDAFVTTVGKVRKLLSTSELFQRFELSKI